MNTDTYIKESRVDKLDTILGIQTVSGIESFKRQIHLFSSDIPTLHRRQNAILALKDANVSMDLFFEKVKDLEPELTGFTIRSDVEKNSYEQITYSSWPALSTLNSVPFLLLVTSYFKQFLVPGFALSSPILMIVLPYFMLKYWYSLSLTPTQYTDIMLMTLGIAKEPMNLKQIVQLGLTFFSVVQSIIQPIQNAFHIRTVDADMVKKGEAIERLTLICHQLIALLPDSFKPKNPLESMLGQLGDPRRNFSEIWDNPFPLKMALQTIGDIEVLYRLATCEELRPVRFVKKESTTALRPYVKMSGAFDPFIDIRKRKSFVADFHSKPHAILTGPNRGGKSSVLRSFLLNVYCAQVFGFAFFTGKMSLRPFTWIASGLKVEDKPGVTSLFETEVEFAIKILKRAATPGSNNEKQLGLVLFDELFHSTNPPDGSHTASVFLRKLWRKTNVASFISTHVFELAKKAPESVNRLCVPATVNKDGRISFTYELREGICEVSSVDDILREKGLLPRP